MSRLIVAILVLQLAVPLILIGWTAAGRRRRSGVLLLDAALGAANLAAIALAGLWLALPFWLVPVLATALGGATLFAWTGRARRANPATTVRAASNALFAGLRRVPIAVRSLLLVLFAGVAGYAHAGRRTPVDAVDLAFPLASGDYRVASGGGNTLINPHLTTLTDTRFAAYRGQSHAVDLVGVGAWGSRTRGLSPRDPAAYAIFGATVVAPCDGRVRTAVDGRPDMVPPERDREHIEGNHVILECGDLWVVLAHFRYGSVQVAEGEHVRTGQPIAAVGNSGQSDEPHLHVHVQRPGSPGAPLSGDPVPARFGERWLVRGQRVRVP